MSNTNAEDVSIQAVEPESICIAVMSCMDSSLSRAGPSPFRAGLFRLDVPPMIPRFVHPQASPGSSGEAWSLDRRASAVKANVATAQIGGACSSTTLAHRIRLARECPSCYHPC